MKDLLPKSLERTAEKTPARDTDSVMDELQTNIERYSAQGYDVTVLKDLTGAEPGPMLRAIEAYRENVKKLNTAMTVLRSLEGYGYSSEIESVMNDIRNPSKADEVLARIEALRERAISEHNLDKGRKETPKTRVLKELKVASQTIQKGAASANGDQISDISELSFDNADVDSLMEDLADLGSAFQSEVPQPVADRYSDILLQWTQEGFFIDRIKEMLLEEGKDHDADVERFQKEVDHIKTLKARLEAIDPTGFEERVGLISLKLPYTYMAKDIEHDIEELEEIRRNKEAQEQHIPVSEPEEAPEGVEVTDGPLAPTAEELPEDEPASEESPEGPIPQPEGHEEGAPVPETPEGADMGTLEGVEDDATVETPSSGHLNGPEPPGEPNGTPSDIGQDLSLDELLELAKDAYGSGDLKRSLELFNALLEKDPENSKARFMIRRISQKV